MIPLFCDSIFIDWVKLQGFCKKKKQSFFVDFECGFSHNVDRIEEYKLQFAKHPQSSL